MVRVKLNHNVWMSVDTTVAIPEPQVLHPVVAEPYLVGKLTSVAAEVA